MHSYAPSLAGVVGRLEAARRRLIAQGVLAAALWALAAGLALFGLLELLRRLAPALGQGPDSALAAGLASAAIFAAGTILAFLRAPSIDQLARRADHRFGLGERLSTALELGRTTAAPPVVIAALLADTLHHAGIVTARELAVFRLPLAALVVPLAALAAAAITFVPVQPLATGAIIEAQLDATLGAPERAVAVDDITRVADVIREQANATDDTYMQAVATTLDDLGDRLALTPDVTRGEMLDQLASLLDYARAASTDAPGAEGERIPQLVEALQQSLALPPPADQPAAAPGSAPVADQPTAAATDSAAGSTQQSPTTSVASLLDELAQRNDDPEMGAANRLEAREEVLDYMAAAQAPAAARAQPKARQRYENTQEMFGAQADAGAAEEQLAGEGTDPISDAPIAQRVDLDATAAMVLTGEDTGEGRHFQVEITPEAKLTTVSQQGLAANTGGWQRATETEAGRYAIGIDDRDTVSRYLRSLLGPAQP